MIDPSYDREDYESDAQVTVLEGRLTPHGIGTAIKNAHRDHLRKRGTVKKHKVALAKDQTELKEITQPLDNLIVSDSAIQSAKALMQKDPKLLCMLLLRQLGIDRDKVAEIAGCTAATVSRSKQNAARRIGS
ncbi:MAG: hypothetical protein AAGG38_14725 [Planctomycetota bacterium]